MLQLSKIEAKLNNCRNRW